jgi:hypothetical protein
MWGALSDERRGLSFTIMLAPDSAVTLGSESHGTQDQILLSQIRDFLNLENHVPIFEQGGPIIPPGTWSPFRRLLPLAGLRWRY